MKWILTFSGRSAARSKLRMLNGQKLFCQVQFVQIEQKATSNVADEDDNEQHVSLQAGNILRYY